MNETELYNEQKLKSSISKSLCPVYVLYGDDDYLVRLYEKKITDASVGDNADFNYHRFDNPKDLQGVYDAAAQLPMMNDYTCVLLRDFDVLKCKTEEFDRLKSIISAGFDTTVLILSFSEVMLDEKKNDRTKKLISAVEKAGGIVARLDCRTVSELARVLCGTAQKSGCTMDIGTAKYLVESVGQEINTINSEISKLIAYAGARDKIITNKTIDEICVKTVEASVYQIQSELLRGNSGKAIELIDNLIFAKVEPTVIFATMATAYNEIFIARAALKSKISTKTAAEDFGYKSRVFVLDKATDYAKRLSAKQIIGSLEALQKCDETIKNFSTGTGANALERLAVELAEISKSGGKH